MLNSKIFICEICGKNYDNIYKLSGHKHCHSEKWVVNRKLKEDRFNCEQKKQSNEFLQNKYTKLYYNIIEHARITNTLGYKETHHILPTCMGGNNEIGNLIKLSAREHFIVHILLPKMVKKNSNYYHRLICAAILFKYSPSSRHKRYLNSRLYETIKKEYSKLQSTKVMGKNNPMYNKTWVSHMTNRISILIDKEHLQSYLQIGYIHKRIINFHKSEEREAKEQMIKEKKTKEKELNFCIQERYYKNLFEEFVNSKLTYIKFCESVNYQFSHVTLWKQFKKYNLI